MDRPSASGESSARKLTPPVASSSSTSTSASRPSGLIHTRQKNSTPDLTSDRKNGQVSDKRPARTSRDSLRSRGEKTPEPVVTPNESEKMLSVLKTEFDSVRTHITCKICYGLLYEPYTTSCGHTYCYNCLCKSFANTTPKSCPECRTTIRQAPAPSYLIREITIGFIKRAELLPKGETIEQHAEWQKEHADIVQRDKADTSRHGGLFRGCFPTGLSFLQRHRGHVPARAAPIRDPIDGVTRCPYCHWELEDGGCPHCGLPFDENGTGSWDDSSAIEGYNPSEGDPPSSEDLAWIHALRSDPVLDQDPDYDEDDGFDDIPPDYDDELQSAHFGYGPWIDSDPGGTIQRYFSSLSHAPSTALSTAGSSGSARRAFHSAIGSRRRSYTASMASDYADTEMGTLEEEDEEDDDDSSMSGFINDGSVEGGSQSSSSVVGDSQRESVPQSPSRVNIPENDAEDDDEDSGPVPPSRRRRRADSNTPTPSMSQPSQRRRLRGHMSPHSASGTIDSASNNAEDDEGPASTRRTRPITQRSPSGHSSTAHEALATSAGAALPSAGNWNWGYTPLGRESQDTGMEGDEESDGGRTTVGWEPNTNSHIRSRTGGSLTPTADRPNPLARPHSRSSNSRVPLGSRGLRRRSSILSNSTVHYEDNDADDDGSSVDEDGDVDMTRVLQARSSRILRPAAPSIAENGAIGVAQLTSPGRRNSRAGSIPSNFARQQGFGDGVAEVDSDDTDISGRSSRQGRINQVRQREYDPRISFLFAQHHQSLREVDGPDLNAFGPLDQLRGLNRTPLARPRTSNRNRTPNNVVAQNLQQSPGTVPRNVPNGYAASRARNLTMENQLSTDAPLHSRPGLDRNPSSSSRATASSVATDQHGTGTRSDLDTPQEDNPAAAISRTRSNDVPSSPTQPSLASFRESLGRPESRVSHRASPATGHRNGMPPAPQFVSMGPGLNTARIWQNRNPFFNQIRPRTSNQRLREQSSTATLRPQGSNRTLRNQQSRNSIQNAAQPSPQIRPQASRMHLPSQAAQPMVQVQSPTRQPQAFAAQSRQAVHDSIYNPLRATRPQVPTASAVPAAVDGETARRAAALVEQRREEIFRREEAIRGEEIARRIERIRRESEQPSVQHVPTTANPFARGQRPVSQQSTTPSIAGASTPNSSRGSVQLHQNTAPSSIQGGQPVSLGVTRTIPNANSSEPSVLNPRRASRALPPSTSFVSASSLHSAGQQTSRTRSGQPHGGAMAESSMRAALPRGATLNSPTLASRA